MSPWIGYTRFGTGFVAFSGAAGDNEFHTHDAVQIVLSDIVSIELDGSIIKAKHGAYVRPRVRHRLRPSTDVQVYLIEPHSMAGRYLLEHLRHDGAGPLDNGEALLADAIGSKRSPKIDIRLKQVLDTLSGPDALQTSIAHVARCAGLSSPRLRELAAKQLGMTMGRWRLWNALGRASSLLAEGRSIADAAHEAGFSDQSHFTRTMRATLGVTPRSAKSALR